MSNEVNDAIQEEIVEMIAQLRPDLSEDDSSTLYLLCVDSLDDTTNWAKEVKRIIKTYR